MKTWGNALGNAVQSYLWDAVTEIEKRLAEALPPGNPEELWRVPEVAKYLREHEKTVYAWVESRKLPCLRVGRNIRFRRSDITRWLASREG